VTKKFIESLIFFVLSLLLLVASSLAWFSITSTPDVDELINTVGKYKVTVKLEAKFRDSEEYTEITTQEQIAALLDNSIPNAAFDFRLTITNESSSNIKISLMFSDFLSEASKVGYDMLDVFFLEDGKVFVEDDEENEITNYIVSYISDDTAYDAGGMELELYRFSNLITNGRFLVFNDLDLPYDQTRVILFTIRFDKNTENPAYEDAKFSIKTIEIFLQ